MKINVAVLLLALASALSAQVQLRYEPQDPRMGPYPSNFLTVADTSQASGRRVNLPQPAGCPGTLSDCTDVQLLNQLDGFSPNPRVRFCFTGPINPVTVPNGTYILALDSLTLPLRVQQVFYDPATNCVSAKPESPLESGKRYVLAITSDVRSPGGQAVRADAEFSNCILRGAGTYCGDIYYTGYILNLINRLIGDRLVGMSIFTTMNATDWVSKSRTYVNASTTPSGVQFVGPADGIPLAAISKFEWLPQTNVDPAAPRVARDIPLSALAGVERVVFGLYLSPNFLATSGPQAGTIPYTPTGRPIAAPVAPEVPPFPPGFVPVSFHVFLPPAASRPSGGFPVAIYGHGLTDSQFGATTAIAATLARQGIALIAPEIQGHGCGSSGSVRLTVGGAPVELPAPGRGVYIGTPGGAIGDTDGCILPGAFATRDCMRQSAVDTFALIRAIKQTNGLGLGLDVNRINLIGQSFGTFYGSMVAAFEPSVRSSVFNVGGGSVVDVARLAFVRPLGDVYLATRNPPLLNAGMTFDDNYVFRGQVPVTNAVPGAPAINDAFEVADWFNMPGDALSYASRLRGKRVLFQFAKCDYEVPNPMNSALIRAAGAQSVSRYFRFDLAQQVAAGQLQPQPHRFLANPDAFSTPAQSSVAIAAQEQVARFLRSDGTSIPNANTFLTAPFAGMNLFETPQTLPDRLNFNRATPGVCLP